MISQVSQSHHAILAVEDTPKMTITDGSVTLTSTAGNHATDVVGSDVFILSGTTANVSLVGDATISFMGASSLNVTATGGQNTITATKGADTFTSLGGSLDVTGGSVGADAYRVGTGSQGMTINDFSLAKGDTLTVDSFFKGKATEMSDGAGGTVFEYQTGPHHFLKVDLVGVSNVSTNIIHYAPVG